MSKDIIFSDSLNRKLSEIKTIKLNGCLYTITYIIRSCKFGEYNYFTLRGKIITYWDSSVGSDQPLTEDNKWIKEGRKQMKVVDFLQFLTFRIRTEDGNLTEDLELKTKIINRFGEILIDKSKASELKLEYKISDKVDEIYSMEIHKDAGDTLKNSCMRGASSYNCRNYAFFYNLAKVKVLYGTLEEQLLFRALLWNNGKDTLLDRVYGKAEIIEYLHTIAEEDGWKYRSYNSATLSDNSYFYYELPQKAVEYLYEEGTPYIDTLGYLKGLVLSNNSDHHEYDLSDCDGISLGSKVYCENCGDLIDPDDCYHYYNDSLYCENCFDERYFICEHCGESFEKDELCSCGYHCYCSTCASESDYVQCYRCEEYTDDYVTTYDGDGDNYCRHCADRYLQQCDECGEYFLKSEITNDLCEECFKLKEKEENECIKQTESA